MKFGLIGKSLLHSFSSSYFEAKFQKENIAAKYQNLEFASEEELRLNFNSLIKIYKGLNITIPYKKTLLDIVDEIDPVAKQIGAINCVCCREGKTMGYNTDYLGFYDSIKKKSFSRNRKALILGNGGAAQAVQYAVQYLLQMSMDIAARNGGTIDWAKLAELNLSDYSLIINTTPLGMFPDEDAYPMLSYVSAVADTLFVDLIYNPMITQFLIRADEQGCMILNGLPMLHRQAELSWSLWNS